MSGSASRTSAKPAMWPEPAALAAARAAGEAEELGERLPLGVPGAHGAFVLVRQCREQGSGEGTGAPGRRADGLWRRPGCACGGALTTRRGRAQPARTPLRPRPA